MGKHKIRAARMKLVKKTDSRNMDNQNKYLKETHIDIPAVTEADKFFEYNPQLGPPYHVLLDTSFLYHAVRYRIDIIEGLITLLNAKVTPYITDCIMSELEKQHQRFSIALRIARDPRIKRIHCNHVNVGYGDDCLCYKVTQTKSYMVASNDRELRARIRKIPGVPLIYAKPSKVFGIERLPDADVL